MRVKNVAIGIGLLTVSLMLAACGEVESDPLEAIQSSLDLESGGFALTDESPGFEDPDLDEEVDIVLGVPPDEEEYTGQHPPPPPHLQACPHGRLKGVLKAQGKNHGIFKAKWVTAERTVVGHLRGIYGLNKKGQSVFFGKYIDLAGKVKGLIKGRYGKGFFRGRWFDKSGLKGMLRGVYGKHHFKGRWTAACPRCEINCKPGFIPAPDGRCFCVPKKIVPCRKGQCPQDMLCDICPPICRPGDDCPPVCGPPVCIPKPPPPQSQLDSPLE